jgi:alpha-glucan,water dikinase
MSAGSRDWVVPPEEYWPQNTHTAGHIAVENKFLDCDDDECDVDIHDAVVPLQRMTLMMPPGAPAV